MQIARRSDRREERNGSVVQVLDAGAESRAEKDRNIRAYSTFLGDLVRVSPKERRKPEKKMHLPTQEQ